MTQLYKGKPKKHRHKWEKEYNECRHCGFEILLVCECGEEKEYEEPKKITKNNSK